MTPPPPPPPWNAGAGISDGAQRGLAAAFALCRGRQAAGASDAEQGGLKIAQASDIKRAATWSGEQRERQRDREEPRGG